MMLAHFSAFCKLSPGLVTFGAIKLEIYVIELEILRKKVCYKSYFITHLFFFVIFGSFYPLVSLNMR